VNVTFGAHESGSCMLKRVPPLPPSRIEAEAEAEATNARGPGGSTTGVGGDWKAGGV
jgi:hypothetical protein